MRVFKTSLLTTWVFVTATSLATAQEPPAPAMSAGTPTSEEITSTEFFVDPATGLKWASQLIGPTYKLDPYGKKEKIKISGPCRERDSCYQDEIKLSWWASVPYVNEMTLDGQKGWRLPTRAELEAILAKLSTPGYPQDYKFLTNCRTSDAGKSPGTVLAYDRYFRESQTTRGFIEEPATKESNVCAVAGSSPSPEFAKIVARAMSWNGDAKYPVSDKQATAAEQQIQEAKAAQKYLADEQKEKQALGEKIAKEMAQRKARLNALRTNPKPGDKAQQGLVLETKGDLVRLQQHERVCVSTSGSACSEWRVRETGHQIWVRKSDLQLP